MQIKEITITANGALDSTQSASQNGFRRKGNSKPAKPSTEIGTVQRQSISKLIGAKISVLRLEKRMTLESLSDGTGLTPSFLSKLERGRTSVSVDNLHNIASFLGLDIFKLLEEGTGHSPAVVTPAGKGAPFRIINSTSRIEALVPISRSTLQVHLHTTEPSQGKEIAFSHPGEEIVYVLSGEIRYWVNNEYFDLKTGDTIWHPSTQPHRYENIGKRPSRTLCVSTPPVWFNLGPVDERLPGSRPRGRTRAKLKDKSTDAS